MLSTSRERRIQLIVMLHTAVTMSFVHDVVYDTKFAIS